VSKSIEYKGVKIAISTIYVQGQYMLDYKLLDAEGNDIEYLRGGGAVSAYKKADESSLIKDAEIDIDNLIADGRIVQGQKEG
jgi:hypothetical protein